MRFTYSRSDFFPALILPAVVASTEDNGVLDTDAYIDTGSDLSIIPDSIRIGLNLRQQGFASGSGARGDRWNSLPVYFVRLRVAQLDWFNVKVITSNNNYTLLGRDILNQCILHADGPAGFFELTLPAKKS